MHVENKFMEVYYNMLIQNHTNMLPKKMTSWGGGAMVKNLIP
jgi:hypothetical protein